MVKSTMSRQIPKYVTRPYYPFARMLNELGEAFERDGDIIQVVGFPIRIFCFRDPQDIEQIFHHPDVSRIKYTRLLPRLKWIMPKGGIIHVGDSDWKERRRQVQRAFTSDYLDHYSNQITEVAAPLIESWSRFEATGQIFDICKAIQSVVVKASYKIFFSTELGDDELEQIRDDIHFIELNFVRPSPLWLPLPRNLGFRRRGRRLRRHMAEIVRKRRTSPRAAQDSLAVLLEMKDPKTGQDAPEKEIIDEAFSLLFGATVMSAPLAWGLYLIATHDEVQHSIVAETDAVLGGRDALAKDLKTLEYIDMTMSEVLRLYQPFFGYPRFCLEGMQIGDYAIPPRSVVMPMVYHTHRHPGLWEQPEEFNPERFRPKLRRDIHPFAYMPFGRGPRMCLGANLAPMIMKLVLASVFQRYRLEYHSATGGPPVADIGFETHPREILMSLKPVRSTPEPRTPSLSIG